MVITLRLAAIRPRACALRRRSSPRRSLAGCGFFWMSTLKLMTRRTTALASPSPHRRGRRCPDRDDTVRPFRAAWRARAVAGSAGGGSAAVVERIPRCVRLRRGTRRNGDGGSHHVGPETDLQQHPTPGGDRRIRNGHCGFDLPNRSTRESHRVPSDEEPDPDPSSWRASGADAAATGGGPPLRRGFERRVRRRIGRRVAAVPREARCPGRRPAPVDADQPEGRR